ncbi:MAG TPA: permease-like cell division protein FtsX [Arenicellales bacterium]|nr:permease-like cell division protein FtsX [Arenicellales bacterium]
MISYLRANLQVFADSVAQLARSPGTAVMTVAAIGVTLALPALLYVITENIDQLGGHLEGQARVNLFLSRDVEDPSGVQDRLHQLADIAVIEAVPPERGLADFKAHSGFAAASELLDSNPLPWTLVVQLAQGHRDIEAVQAFVEGAAALPEVDNVRSDVLWLRRLAAMVAIGHRLVWVLAVLLGFAVVVIISNTVRLAILSRAHEIEVIKLIGGTDRFIRRPFLYQGFAQGALGAIAAVLAVTVCVEALRVPVTVLVGEYGGGYRLLGLDWAAAGALLGLGSGLGWCASRWSVGRHLKDIEPR